MSILAAYGAWIVKPQYKACETGCGKLKFGGKILKSGEKHLKIGQYLELHFPSPPCEQTCGATVKRTKNAEVKRLSAVRRDYAVGGGFARLTAASLNWGTQQRRHFEKPTHISYVEHNRFISELLALKLV